MKLEEIDKLCDQYESRLKLDPDMSVQKFLQEQDVTSNESLLRELELVAEDYQRRTANASVSEVSLGSPTVGNRIGPYALIEQIGEGGMGTVYLAEQTAPVKRQVALKVIRQGLDSKEVLARFESERQALAMMDHENIAAMYDAGTFKGGLPYFAMELVRGEPLTTFCDNRALSIRERLKLLVRVCRAVQHAHQKGIIHRDIKPSNILVANEGEAAVPKVIDFGVAKALQQRLTDKTLSTEFGRIVGTLQYMSPEQASLSNFDVDTRSDVYSLGVLLYEMLTGSTPIEKSQVREVGWEGVLQIIREEQPPRPSSRLMSKRSAVSGATPEDRSFGSHIRELRGDLDWITMKALATERSHRFDSAGALADDIERFLTGNPVQARPPSFAYWLRKFVAKNRTVAAASLVALLAVIIGGTAVNYGRIAANEAAREAEFSERESLARLQQMDKLLSTILGDLENGEDAGSVKEQLTKNLAKLAADFSLSDGKHPAAIAKIQNQIGSSLITLGKPAAAIDILNDAVATRSAEFGDDAPETQQSLINLAAAHQVVGHLAEASRLYEQRIRWNGPLTKDGIMGMNNWALACDQNGEFQKAVDLLEKACELSESFDPLATARVQSRYNLASVYCSNGRFAESLRMLDEIEFVATEGIGKGIGENDPLFLKIMDLRARVNIRRGKLAIAIKELKRLVSILDSKPELRETDRALKSKSDLAVAYRNNGQLEKSIQLFRQVIELKSANPNVAKASVLTSMSGLAKAYQLSGDLGNAIDLYRKTYHGRKKVLSAGHPRTLLIASRLATALGQTGQNEEAVMLFEEALGGFAKLRFADPRFTPVFTEAVASWEKSKRYDLTDKWFKNWLGAIKEDEQKLSRALSQYSQVLMERGDSTAAEKYLRQCLELKLNQVESQLVRRRLGRVLLELENYFEAEQTLLSVYSEIAEQVDGSSAKGLTELKGLLVRVYTQLGRLEEAKKYQD